MAVIQSQYTLGDDSVHLRDYRHAQNLFYQYGMALAPKTKFLYHCLFEPSPEVGNSGTANSFKFQKQIGVLVKSADLPSFRVSIENKKQYNRVKQFQTRLDYSDVNITFHDDNLGVTRSMLEEYYKYYWLDGRHDVQKNALISGPYASRDKYSENVPKYGLNNEKTGPFFTSITLYQLSKQKYFAYTLVNPIISQWNHGNVDASDGSGLNENSVSIAYESVIFTKGTIGQDSQPVAFGDPETGYDQTPSPLSEPKLGGNQYISNNPKLIEPIAETESRLPRNTNAKSVSQVEQFREQKPNILKQFATPKIDTKNITTPIAAPSETDVRTYDRTQITRSLDLENVGTTSLVSGSDRVNARYTFVAKSINSGALPGITNMPQFKALYPTINEQNKVIDQLLSKVSAGNKKLTNLASESIGKYI